MHKQAQPAVLEAVEQTLAQAALELQTKVTVVAMAAALAAAAAAQEEQAAQVATQPAVLEAVEFHPI
jgi:hypothetical protein